MEEAERSVIGGFAFADPHKAEQAKKEQQALQYLSAQINMDRPEAVLQVYSQMIERKLFSTQVGYSYLKKLQEYLLSQPQFSEETIPPIPIDDMAAAVQETESPGRVRREQKKRRARADRRDYRKLCSFLGTVCAILAISVAGMLVLAATGDNPTIINYEEKLINKYADWETELMEREAEVLRREQALK